MEFFKVAPREKTEEGKIWEVAVKNKALYSSALTSLTEEYPEKFGETIDFIPVVKEETIIFTGNFDILKTEVYEKVLEYNREKKNYKIILRKKD